MGIRIFLFMVFSLSIVFAGNIHYKLIVTANTDSQVALKNLQKLQAVFENNALAKELLDRYRFSVHSEALGDKILTVVGPLSSAQIRTELIWLLKPTFPEIFSIKSHPISSSLASATTASIPKGAKVMTATRPAVIAAKPERERSNEVWIWGTMGLLFIVGFVIILRRVLQAATIQKLQQKLGEHQSKIQEQISRIGGRA